ncbi:Uncharacterised protein [Klebsiella pneumoniae]|uniref:hypothetical protein n=1 Tax=Klebsiella pneumoniae TaxID=573 RepID=UPI000E2AC90D|nr:hypothetical protein [Klebsiella pneumoniae]MEA4774630.1 hypothetical protein [Klebsiella pneumoniae]SVN46583.1 Uncharacterised protein [Klebsiella pneumoniae]
MSEFSRETLLNIIETGHVQCGEASALARMALAAMDSEPHTDDELSNLLWYSQEATCHSDPNYYCEFQRLATPGLIAGIIRELQERRKAAMDSKPVILYRQINPVNGMKTYWAELDPEEFRHLKQHTDENAEFMTLYRHAQPAPVVPDAATAIRACLSEFPESARDIVEECADIAENACRAAMLQAGNSPAQSDCCPAQNVVVPAQSPIVHGYLPECECSGCKATARICTEMAVNSPANPGCWCRTCRPVDLNDMRFMVCPDCGNKRCPRANDHRNACTGSNEPGQEGSAYPDTPREVK